MLKQDGTVWAAGGNSFGQLGIDPASDITVLNFVEVVAGGAEAVATGSRHSMVLKKGLADGSVWCTGRNTNGQLGDGSNVDRHSFVQVILSYAKAIAAGTRHSLVMMRDGSVRATGYNLYGQLGDGSMNQKSRFIQVISRGAKAIAAGSDHSMVLKQDGSVWTTGLNWSGQLGDGSSSPKRNFVQVVSSQGMAISAGGYHSLVLKQDGTVWATGENKYGQLGDGTKAVRYFMHPVAQNAKGIAAGYDNSMVLKQDGSVWTTGRNSFGQLGDGTTTSRISFVEVIPSSDVITRTVKTVAAGDGHSMVLRYDGSLWATGVNGCGQIGDGTMLAKTVFVKVLPPGEGSCCMMWWVSMISSIVNGFCLVVTLPQVLFLCVCSEFLCRYPSVCMFVCMLSSDHKQVSPKLLLLVALPRQRR